MPTTQENPVSQTDQEVFARNIILAARSLGVKAIYLSITGSEGELQTQAPGFDGIDGQQYEITVADPERGEEISLPHAVRLFAERRLEDTNPEWMCGRGGYCDLFIDVTQGEVLHTIYVLIEEFYGRLKSSVVEPL